MLNIVIVGSGEMACSLLLGIKEAGHRVVGFFRQESINLNPLERAFKDLFMPTDFYLLSKANKIKEIKAVSVNTEAFRKTIRQLNADIILVGTWGEKFSKKTILTPKIATINCHPSLLPKHRGPNPYMTSIVLGENKTGITFHLMDENFDTGAILLQEEVPILFSDNGYSLKLRCTQTARKLLKKFLDEVENGQIIPQKQNENIATYYKKITPNDIYIDFSMSSKEIYDKVRGYNPWAFCYLKVRNNFLKIGNAKIINLNNEEYFVNNKKYFIPDRYLNAKAGSILSKGKNWILCSTIDKDMAILLYNLKLFGFCKQFLTKNFISSLKSLR